VTKPNFISQCVCAKKD